MSKFTTPSILEMLGNYKWQVYDPSSFTSQMIMSAPVM
ncbi:Uncharacterised protein [Escherichia coli]|nr:Uncharacterised protein [Escherichia coli]